MQFHHAHAVRLQGVDAVRTDLPDAYDRMPCAGAEPVTMPVPGGRVVDVGLRCRRQIFEAALRAATLETPGLRLIPGHVEAAASEGGCAVELHVDGAPLSADLVIGASARAGRAIRGLRAQPAVGRTCGIANVDR